MPESREILSLLNKSVKSIRSVGESYVCVCSTITSIGLFIVLCYKVGILDVNILSPLSLAGLLIGTMIPFKFTSLILDGVNETAVLIIEEIKS